MANVEKYVKHQYEDGEKVFDVRHSEISESEAGFDLTKFPNRSSFQDLINKFNMDYRRVETKNGYLYTWSNSEVMIVTGNNPISGVYRYPNRREKETGYASFIGVEGKKEAVDSVVDEIQEKASHIKAYDSTERSFI